MSEKNVPALDERIQTPEMLAIKAIIPYMEPAAGRMAAVMVKMMEMRAVLEYFDNGGDVNNRLPGQGRSMEMLAAIRPYCDERTSETVGFMGKMLEMLEMLAMAETMSAINTAHGKELKDGHF